MKPIFRPSAAPHPVWGVACAASENPNPSQLAAEEGLDDLPPLGTFTPADPCDDPAHGHGGTCPGCKGAFPWGPRVWPDLGTIPVPNPYTQIDPNPRTEREIEAGKKLGTAIGRL